MLVVGAVVGTAAVLVVRGVHDGPEPSQVDVAIRNYYSVLRDEGLTAATAISCPEVRELARGMGAGYVGVKQDVNIVKVDEVRIEGDVATAKVLWHITSPGVERSGEPESNLLRLELDRGTWRMCTLPE
ncbi:MAG: hypothetical protein HOQ24_12680 [Mycobacteriaceae bacterium]|nr:hypothetical protein [Mycobacteriaceae bacterium]